MINLRLLTICPFSSTFTLRFNPAVRLGWFEIICSAKLNSYFLCDRVLCIKFNNIPALNPLLNPLYLVFYCLLSLHQFLMVNHWVYFFVRFSTFRSGYVGLVILSRIGVFMIKARFFFITALIMNEVTIMNWKWRGIRVILEIFVWMSYMEKLLALWVKSGNFGSYGSIIFVGFGPGVKMYLITDL